MPLCSRIGADSERRITLRICPVRLNPSGVRTLRGASGRWRQGIDHERRASDPILLAIFGRCPMPCHRATRAMPLTFAGMDLAFAQRFADEWVAAWNSHDVERILAHYTDDIVFSSPKIVQLLGDASGQVRGKDGLRAYWARGLELLPDLHFTVEDVRVSIDSLVINYRNERGHAVSEVLTFRDGLVCCGFGAYGENG
jgi:hypothetical protein